MNDRAAQPEDALDPAMVAVLRRKSPEERVRMLDALWTGAVTIVRGSVRAQHPDWNDVRVNAEVARRMRGHDHPAGPGK